MVWGLLSCNKDAMLCNEPRKLDKKLSGFYYGKEKYK